jgi:inositol-phosphate phosphatase / L-galactose 1-phosphate phosphatase / histidinol-phosphatase
VSDSDLDLAGALADAAAAAIRPFFRQPFQMEAKGDASPVTEADRAAEAAMRGLLAQHRPGDGIIGEEYGVERADAARVWVLDPIDGTRSFVAGRPIFGTLTALLEEGVPVLGIIHQPISGERWIGATGRATTLDGVPVRTRACASLGQAHLATTGPGYFTTESYAAFERVGGAARDTLWGGDCYNYGLLAAGHLDLVIEDGLKLYDFAALIPIVEGAGGRMCDWQGRRLDTNSTGQVIAAGDPAMVEAVVAKLA